MAEAQHILDNPIWNALSTCQSHFAEGDGLARRFHAEIGPLAGLGEQSPEAYRSLRRLIKPGEPVALFLDAEPRLPGDWQMIMHKPLTQMICPNPPAGAEGSEESGPIVESIAVVEPLGEADVAAMLELTALTEPGPFRRRTYELGGFLGIRQNGRLAAMAGERLAPPGYTEVSAVCTHPDFRGRGFAQLLVAEVSRRIHKRGETPFLTSFEHNTGAIRVYESVGFVVRRSLHLAVATTGLAES